MSEASSEGGLVTAPVGTELAGVRVVVTGATSGIGHAMAVALLEAGATVALSARPTPRLDESVAELRARGLPAVAVHMDVRDPASVTLGAREAVVALGGIDVVVNNAGIGMRTVNPHFFERPQPFFEVDPAQFSDVIATNLTGYFLVSRAFSLFFLEHGSGRFVNVSINNETMVREGFCPYGPSRAGSEALSDVMVEDLRRYGIAVNLLVPGGATDTGMIPEEIDPEARSHLLPPEIMGPPAVFLASPEAAGMTGACIVARKFDRWLADFRAGSLAGVSLPVIGHWIGGREAAGRAVRRAPVWDPATGRTQAEVALATAADVDEAVESARQAFGAWSQSSLSARTKVLFAFRQLVAANAGELAAVITAEHGKAVDDALGEVQRGLEVVELACGIPELLKGEYSDQVSAGVDVFSYRQPLGVAVGITPFNFPVMVPMWMHPVAIACGNTFVLKPSERDPSVSMLVARLWSQAGLPDGVFNVVNGDREAVERLLDHPDVACVSFVGSTPVARFIHQRANASGKRVQALGGAKNHAVVLPDADLAFAADQLTAAAFGSAGQRCMAISAVVAVGQSEPLAGALAARGEAVRVGPGSAPGTEMGPLVSPDAKARVLAAVDAAERQGARLALDGRGLVVPGHEHGFFVGPTVLDDVRPSMDVYRQEVFGPVLAVLSAADVDEALALVNTNPYGNGAAVFTSSGQSARRFQREVTAGMVGINVPIPVPVAYYSFGGWKDSLFGDRHVHGPEGVSFYTRGKVVTARWPDAGTGPGSLHFPTAT